MKPLCNKRGFPYQYEYYQSNRVSQDEKLKATLVLTRVDVPLEYGVVITDKSGAITGFLEKPSWGEVFSDTVNTGTYILEPEY